MKMYEEFFEWIYQKVDGKGRRTVLEILYETEFYALIPQDNNRIQDGVSARYKFAKDVGIPELVIDEKFDSSTCSVLEMMYGLAIRIEDTIMSDKDFGDRTNIWFWMMIKSLGLYWMEDSRINCDLERQKEVIKHVVEGFLNRGYESNGAGGLFTVNDTSKDMRDIEIWYQMCMFLDNLL